MYEQLAPPEGFDFAPMLGVGMLGGALVAAVVLCVLLAFMRPR